jgi:hypothetical protein
MKPYGSLERAWSEPVEQRGREVGIPPVDIAEALTPQRKSSAVIGGEPDDHREGLVPTEIIIAGMPPGILAHGRSFFTEPSHRAWPSLRPGAAGQLAGVSRSRRIMICEVLMDQILAIGKLLTTRQPSAA